MTNLALLAEVSIWPYRSGNGLVDALLFVIWGVLLGNGAHLGMADRQQAPVRLMTKRIVAVRHEHESEPRRYAAPSVDDLLIKLRESRSSRLMSATDEGEILVWLPDLEEAKP